MSDEAEASAVAERESHSTEQCSAEAQKCTGRIAEPPKFLPGSVISEGPREMEPGYIFNIS